MPWAEKLPSGRYRACWRDDAGRQRSRSSFVQEAQALRWAGEQEGKTRRGELVSTGRSPSWEAWCAEWLQLRRVEPSTARQDAMRIRKHLQPKWGKQRLNRITRPQIQAWVNTLERADGLAPATVQRVYHLMSASMKAAVYAGILAVNPCSGIVLPTPEPGHERFLTRGEFDLALANMGEPCRSAAIGLATTGMRFGELAGLHWDQVDMLGGTITVLLTWDEADRRVKAYPKSKKQRTIPIPTALRGLLEQLWEADPPTRSCGLEHAGRRKCASSLVFTAAEGGPLDSGNLRHRQFAPALAAAGIAPARLHDLRHSYASWLVQAGVPLQAVGDLLGHASLATTMRYAHFGTTQHDMIRDVLDGAPYVPHKAGAGRLGEVLAPVDM